MERKTKIRNVLETLTKKAQNKYLYSKLNKDKMTKLFLALKIDTAKIFEIEKNRNF